MSTINSKNVQVGTSGVATDNFTLYQPATPDGTVRLGVGNSGATTADVVTVNSAGMTVTGSLSATTLSGSLGAATATSLVVSGASTTGSLAVNGNNISAVNSLGFRNRIFNGGMVIDQRNAGASVTITNTAAVTYTLDRWNAYGGQASKFSVQQNAGAVTPPNGFIKYLGVTSLSAYSIGVSDIFNVAQIVEGFNTADLGWGTASAVSVTLSFWVRSSLTGTFGGAFGNGLGSRSYPFTYTISSANTWEQKSITVAGDTSGTWNKDNSAGMAIYFSVGTGTTFSGTAGAWAAANYQSATGAVSVVGTNGATFYITGVQLEAGTVASPFERRDYGRELAMCQRYYATGASYLQTAGTAPGGSNLFSSTFKVTMRVAPTAAVASTIAGSSTSINFITVDQLAFTGVPDANGRVAGTWTASAEL